MRAFLFFILCLCIPHLIKPNFKIPPRLALPYHPEWEVPRPDPEILAILNQPFTYLSHGNQSTVFQSQDGRYVLKLFRSTRPRFPLIQNLKCHFASWKHKKPKNDLVTKTIKTLTAAHIAFTEASAFTQVFFCHLNLTENLLPTATLKAHRTYHLPLDRCRFVLQRKVTPFKEALLAAKGDPEKMHQLIESFFRLLTERAALGIRNSDPNLGPNFGFLDDQAVEIDFGNYRRGSDPREMENYRQRFKDWLAKNAPEYLQSIQL